MAILIEHAAAVLMDEGGTILPDAWAAVEGSQISYVGDRRPQGSFDEVMTLFDVLCWSREGARLSGEWVTLSALGGGVHTALASDGIFGGAIERFAAREEGLSKVLEGMGGVRMPKGEPGYQIPVFPFLPLYFQYWRGDEEFPPQLTLLWDKNTTQFLHYETVYYLTGFLLQRVAALLERDGPAREPN